MTTRGQINSNFYQIVDVDSDGNPTDVKEQYIKSLNATISNVHISGGTNGQFLSTDGAGNLSWTTGGGGGNGVPGGSNTQIQFNDAGVFGGNTSLTYDKTTDVLTVPSVTGNGNIDIGSNFYKGDGGYLTNVNATTGNANFATYSNYANYAGNAFSVAGSNVTGTVANANYATYSGTAFSVSGSNVSGQVSNANFANYSNIANSANSVAVANVSGIGNIATINLNGNGSQTLAGNGVWVTIPNVANANFANFAGNVTVAAQPNITSLGSLSNLQFNNTVTPITPAVGQMFWDTNEHTVSLGMENGVIQQIGLENYIYAKADTTITDGQVVMMTGANGNNVTVAPANVAAPSFTVQHVLGIATQDIATNGFGYITTFGQVHGLNTNSYNVGDVLWLSTTTPGAFTNVRPTDPNYQVQVATVTKKSAGDGHIQVLVYPFTPLTNLTDVQITTPTTGQALVYNGSNVWINGIPNIANIAYSVSGSNVSGQVANANFANYSNVANSANSVAVANVSGIGNIATINLTGSSSTVLYGNGVWAGISGGANANFANFAGNVINAAQPNITSLGTLTSLAVTANTTTVPVIFQTGSNTPIPFQLSQNWDGSVGGPYTAIYGVINTLNSATGDLINLKVNGTTRFQVSSIGAIAGNTFTGNYFIGSGNNLSNIQVANVTGLGNIATINLTGSTSNVLYGNGIFAELPTTANANFANYAGNVTVAAQANITSLGTLTSLTVSGSASSGNYNIVNSYVGAGEGGQLVLAWKGITGLTGQANSTWNMDSEGSNNFRIFSQDSSGTARVNFTAYSANSDVSFGGNISTTGTGNIANVILKTYEETVLASANTSTSISPDFSTGTIFRYTANNNFTFNGFTNAVAGSSGTVIITQDGTGSRTMTSTMKFAGNSKTLSTAASSIDIICVFYDGTTYYASLTKGYA